MRIQKLLMLLMAIGLFSITSCVKNDQGDCSKKDFETYSKVNFTLGGELSIIETPITKAAGDKDLYGIKITKLVKEGNNAYYSQNPYAYGFFEQSGMNNLEINLLDGYKYRVSCTALIDVKDSVQRFDTGYDKPFVLDRDGLSLGAITNKFVVSEKFNGTVEDLYWLEDSEIGTDFQRGIKRPFAQRYHGVIEELEVIPNSTNELMLYGRFFNVVFIANGLQSGKELWIQLDDAPVIKLTSTKTQSGEISVSLKSLTDKVDLTSENPLSESFKVKGDIYENGKHVKTIIDHNMTFQRMVKHTITISDIDHFGTPGGLSIKIATENISSSNNIDIPWQSKD